LIGYRLMDESEHLQAKPSFGDLARGGAGQALSLKTYRRQHSEPFARFSSLVSHCMLPGASAPPQARGAEGCPLLGSRLVPCPRSKDP